MNKINYAWTLALAAALALAGCAGSNGTATDSSPTAPGAGGRAPTGKALRVGVVFDSGGLGDKSFNDSAWAGIQRAKTDFAIDESHVESKTMKDFEPNLTALAEQGLDLVVAVGATQSQALQNVAPKFPNTKFVIIDTTVKGENVRSIRFAEHEGSFLAGYLAGLMSKSGKIGFVGGMELDLIKKFQFGYEAGAKTANPNIELLPAKYTQSWDDLDKGKAAANILFSSGADIVYHAAGRAGLGVISAAKEQKKFAIGVDSDQDGEAKGTVLTSMVKSVDESLYRTIKDLSSGKFEATEVTYDVKSGLVGLSEMKFTKDSIGKDNLEKLSAVREKIVKGTLKPPATAEDLSKFLAAKPDAR